jgi:hypothetical protein
MPRVAVSNRITQHNIPYSLRFDGSKRVVFNTLDTFGSSLTGPISFGLRVQTNSILTTAQYLLGCVNSVGGLYFLSGITRTSAKVGVWNIQLRDYAGRILSVEVSSKKINDGAWHLLNYTKDETNTPAGIKTYIDTVDTAFDIVGNTGFANPDNFTRNFALGASHGSAGATNFLNAKQAEFYLWKRVLTPTEISDWGRNGIIPASPFIGLPMDEGDGTTLADVNGVYNATLDNASMWNLDSPRKSRVTQSGRI